MEYEPASFPVLDAEDAIRRAEECLTLQSPTRAMGILGDLTARFPQEARLWYLRGMLAERLGRRQEAEDDYRKAVRTDPELRDCALDLVDLLLDGGRLEEAEALAGRLAARWPDHARALGLLGEARACLGRACAAEASFRKALAIDPSFAWAGRHLSDLLLERGRVDEAHELIVGLLDRDPLDPCNHAYLGEILEGKGLTEAAMASLRTALWLRPGYSWAARCLARMVCRSGGTLQAVEILQRALESKPDDALMIACLGCLEKKLGFVEAAEVCFRRALKIDPDLATAFAGLFDVLLATDRGGDAHALLRDRLGDLPPDRECAVESRNRENLE